MVQGGEEAMVRVIVVEVDAWVVGAAVEEVEGTVEVEQKHRHQRLLHCQSTCLGHNAPHHPEVLPATFQQQHMQLESV